DFFQILRKPQNWCDRARPGVAGAGSSGRAAGAHRRTAVFRRADGRGNSRVTGNFSGHSEAGLDPGENLAPTRTIFELKDSNSPCPQKLPDSGKGTSIRNVGIA